MRIQHVIGRSAPAMVFMMIHSVGIATAAQQLGLLIPGDPVRIDTGEVAGRLLPSGVRVYLGVPYADAPTDDLRWRPPQPARAWGGVLHADRFAPECMQARPAHTNNHYFGEEATSEDCLYLNIWAPSRSAPRDKGYPVILWIHGGGFIEGSPSMPFYQAEGLVQKGAVFVAAAYRLGALGFFAHPQLSAESPHHASGNYGLLDQVAALQWIQRNIVRFGGDPGVVTIIGQSAGAFSISLLQASPLGRGLFHRAFALSGSTFGKLLAAVPEELAEQMGLDAQSALGVSSLAQMRNLPADQIIRTVSRAQLVIDNYAVVAPTADVFMQRRQSDVPLILGFTADEGFSDIGRASSLQEYRNAVKAAYGSSADAVERLYPAANDREAIESARMLARDCTVSLSMNEWARAQSEYGRAPVFAYVFSRANPWGVAFGPNLPTTPGAYHSGDLPYWLGSIQALKAARPTRDWSTYDLELADRMSSLLVAFAGAGVPRGATPVAWPAYDGRSERVMEFGDSISVHEWPNISKLRVLRALARPAAP